MILTPPDGVCFVNVPNLMKYWLIFLTDDISFPTPPSPSSAYVLFCLTVILGFDLWFLAFRYRVIMAYPPQHEAELELRVGDVVYVTKKRVDGWYKGTLERNGKTGLFPGIFVDSF